MKYFYGLLFAVIINLVLPTTLFGQNEFDEWKKKEQEKFKKFADEDDKKFHDFLKKDWATKKVLEGLKDDTKPKPIAPPVLKKVDPPTEAKPKPQPRKETTPAEVPEVKPQPAPEPEAERREPPVPPLPQSVAVSFDFYGTEVSVDQPNDFKPPLLSGKVSKNSIADFWSSVSTQKYAGLISGMQKAKENQKLNDWAYANYIYSYAKKVYKDKRDEPFLLTWFILLRSGYDARIAYSDAKVYLLIATSNRMFGRAFFAIGQNAEKYYVFDEADFKENRPAELTTYEGSHPDAINKFNFAVNPLPDLGSSYANKDVKFAYRGTQYKISIAHNSKLVAFYKDYPQVNYSVYLNTALTGRAQESLLSALRPLLKDMNDIDKADFLLHFVQDATQYKTDQEQFGREKPLFAEESLHYDFTDCEDRSILYSYLIRKLTGLKIVILDYPGHIATAVKFEGIRAGDYVSFDNSNWLVCDPTYLGADIGMCMPDLKKVNPEIIEITGN